jgi:hypothetical protein
MNDQSFTGSRVSRRNFIQVSVALAGTAHLAVSSIEARPVTDSTTPWYRRPLRILQTVLRETDAKNYDADSVVNYLREADCNVLVVNAGGIVDFFRNALPAANPNRFMEERDLLREITDACREAGIRVVGRVDFRGVEEQVHAAHPDWFSIDAQGKPLQLDYTRPQLYAACYTGYYRNEHAEAFLRHLLSNYALDGIWHNSVGVGGICHCARCREAYKEASEKALPEPNASEGDLDQYMEWKTRAADQHMERMRKTVKSFGDDKVYTAEVFSMFESGGRIHSGIDLYSARDHFDFLVSVAFLTENREVVHYEDLSYANTIVRFLKSMAPEKEAVILYGGNGTAHRYVMDPPVDLQVWLWEALAAGGRFWNCNFTGMHPNATHDRRNAFNNKEAYGFVKQHEALLSQHVPVADVGLYYSRPTRLFYRQAPPQGDRFDLSLKGVETVLVEGHVPYTFIPDDQLTLEGLKQYGLLILPNVRCMSDGEMEIIRDYVTSGGNLLASFASSLHDHQGRERADFGLAEVFGCRYTGQKADTRRDSYQFISKPGHPILEAESGRTELLFNAGYTLLCKTAQGASVIATHVPPVHNQPPEKAWAEEWSREFPVIVENRHGKGKVLYFANQADQLSYHPGHPDTRSLLLRGIRHLLGRPLTVQTTAPESVHVGLTRSLVAPNEYILTLVNTTSGPARPLRRLLPVHDIVVTLRLKQSELHDYQVLRAQGACSLQGSEGRLQFRTEKLADFCAVHVRMKP